MGARRAIEGSDYLPTLNRMLASCSDALGELGLPTANAAYEEACLAPSPKAEATWSHPIAYLAGRDTGWYLLANHTRNEAWPAFQVHYNQWLRKALAGETLTIPYRQLYRVGLREYFYYTLIPSLFTMVLFLAQIFIVRSKEEPQLHHHWLNVLLNRVGLVTSFLIYMKHGHGDLS